MSKRSGRKAKNTKSKDNPAVTSVAESENMMLLDISGIQDMKRAQLQKMCKQFGLKASGKVWTRFLSRSLFCLKRIHFKTLKANIFVALIVDFNSSSIGRNCCNLQFLDAVTLDIECLIHSKVYENTINNYSTFQCYSFTKNTAMDLDHD